MNGELCEFRNKRYVAVAVGGYLVSMVVSGDREEERVDQSPRAGESC